MKKIHYSWIILMVTFFSIIVAGIIRSSSGVFIEPFEQEFGWDRPTISFAFATSLVLYGLAGPFMAAFVEKFGLRKMMLFSMGLLVVGLGLTYFMNAEWQLVLVWGGIIGVGSGLFLTVLSAQVANRWFVKRRGLAVGILMAATASGQLVLLPVMAWLVENYSWQSAISVVLVIGIIMFILIILCMRDQPKDVGILALGAEYEESDVQLVGNPFKLAIDTLKEALKVKEFWLLGMSFFICGLSTSGLIGTHFVSYCMSFGIPVVAAASVLSVMGVFDLIGTTASGWLSDRFDSRWLLFWYYILRGLSLVALPFALNSGEYMWLIIFAVFYGLDWIATVPPTIELTRQRFGLKKSAMVYGWVFVFHQLGSGVAAFSGGVIYKVLGSYTWAFLMAGIFCALASLFVLMIKKQPKEIVTA